MVNWLPDVSEVDQPGSSSASIAGSLTAKMGGMVRSGIGIGCWVVAAMGRPCRSHAISILGRIVRATKAATWSHPSVLFSIIGIKLRCVVWINLQFLFVLFHFSISNQLQVAIHDNDWEMFKKLWLCTYISQSFPTASTSDIYSRSFMSTNTRYGHWYSCPAIDMNYKWVNISIVHIIRFFSIFSKYPFSIFFYTYSEWVLKEETEVGPTRNPSP